MKEEVAKKKNEAEATEDDKTYYCPICTTAWWTYESGEIGGSEIPNKDYPFEVEHKICPKCEVEHHERELEKMRKNDDYINPPDETNHTTLKDVKDEKTMLTKEIMHTFNTHKIGPTQKIGYVDVISILEFVKMKYYNIIDDAVKATSNAEKEDRERERAYSDKKQYYADMEGA